MPTARPRGRKGPNKFEAVFFSGAQPFFFFRRKAVISIEQIKLTFDDETLGRYSEHYFELHPRAKKKPIAHPYHESINAWMIMKRPQMNALKQKWKDFITWFIMDQGYANLRISECELSFLVYYATNRPHDVDNTVPKFIVDGLCESGFIVDDDFKHIKKITLEVGIDKSRPRTEITITVHGFAPKEEKEDENGEQEENIR